MPSILLSVASSEGHPEMSGRRRSAVAAVLMVWFAATASVSSLYSATGPGHYKSLHRREGAVGAAGPGTEPSEAMGRLLKVFGLNHPGRRERHYAPPQYMMDLYNAIADSSGITHTVNPYYANIVRSFPDKDALRAMHFTFNISSELPVKERLLEAEFHLYKLKPRARTLDKYPDPRTHLLEVRIYQVMSPDKLLSEDGNRLLDIRRISAHSVGWEVFYVKPAIVDWAKNDQLNYGLFVSVRNLMGMPVEDGMLRFAKRHQHHVNKQPILVTFSDDGRPKQSTVVPKIDFRDYGYPDLSFYGKQSSSSRGNKDTNYSGLPTPSTTTTVGYASYENVDKPKNNYTNRTSSLFDLTRTRRSDDIGKLDKSIPDKSHSQTGGCTRHELYVDFEKIGWSSWIISPKGYNAYHCKGECAFPLGQNQWPTNHATVQSIVHKLNLTPNVDTPCCVPNKLYSISLLYFDEHGNVILKQYDDMVASSCGCH